MAIQAKMKVDKRVETPGATRPQEHFADAHGYDCDCDWIPATQLEVNMSVVTTGDGKENADFAAATPSGEMWLIVDNVDAQGYFEIGKEYYVEIRKARK